MKIVLASPLYPPDIAEPAPYVKELAKRLSATHDVTIVTYGRLPEEVPGVRIITADKRQPLFVRLAEYTFQLWRASSGAIIYAQNGASVELPAGIISFLTGRLLVLRIGDEGAHQRASKDARLGRIERLAISRAKEVIQDGPLPRPEILPFQEFPAAALASYETSWTEHVRKLEELFTKIAGHE